MNVWGRFSEFINGNIILNWHPLTKCCLVMVLGALVYILWIVWYLFVFSIPTMKYWMNESLYHSHLIISLTILIIFLLFAFLSWKFKKNKWIQNDFPYFAILYFGATLIYGGFNVGILSPATLGGYISLIFVGIVLFERKIIYSTVIPVTIFMLVCMVLSSLEKIPYAPLFSRELNQTILSENSFWIYSMLFLYAPIFIFSIILFEILLTQWRNREAQIQHMSSLDPLTNIFNRRSLAQRLSFMQVENQDYALILLDLDHFKHINDHYGHDIGDIVLIKVAKLFNLHLSTNDMAGRYGGEEFLLILQNKTQQQAVLIAEQFRQYIEQEPISLDSHREIYITASFGVAVSEENVNKEMVLKHADQALYLAKNKGRNQVRSYTEVQEI